MDEELSELLQEWRLIDCQDQLANQGVNNKQRLLVIPTQYAKPRDRNLFEHAILPAAESKMLLTRGDHCRRFQMMMLRSWIFLQPLARLLPI